MLKKRAGLNFQSHIRHQKGLAFWVYGITADGQPLHVPSLCTYAEALKYIALMQSAAPKSEPRGAP